MNVFENLITELKEENLLENTVLENGLADDTDFDEDGGKSFDFSSPTFPRKERPETDLDHRDPLPLAESIEVSIDFTAEDQAHEIAQGEDVAEAASSSKTGKEFFHKRAIGEVASLQMVDHVLTGVEREYMKILPKVFDDLDAKKALHAFLNLPEDSDPDELNELLDAAAYAKELG